MKNDARMLLILFKEQSSRQRILFVTLIFWAAFASQTEAFAPGRALNRGWNSRMMTSSQTSLYYSKREKNDGDNSFDDIQLLEERLTEMRAHVMEEEYKRPPNPDLKPVDFISELLQGLWSNSDPLPDSGFRLLLRASTPDWRRKLYESVGAPPTAKEEVVVSALGEAMGRPHNQFAILVGEAEHYVATFPTDPLDYNDGTAWVECQLRDQEDDTLFAVTGWQLKQREDGAWLVDAIDWQDFRDEFRPGIGREEWMRICG